jgi:hypothetical protein
MKKILAAAILVAAIAVPTAFSATTPKLTGGGGSPGDARYQQGGVAVPFFVNVTAQNTGTAPAATGNFTFTRADGTFGGSVDCYVQSGNHAYATGQITSATGIYGGQIGQGFVVGVQDNGQGAGDPPDMIQVDIWPYSPTLCTSYYSSPAFPYAVTTGNFQIH